MSTYGSEPMFTPARYKNKELCLICAKEFKKSHVGNSLTASGWTKFKENARKWSNINIPLNEPFHIFTEVSSKVCDHDEPFGKVHKSCRVNFENKSDRFREKYGVVSNLSETNEGTSTLENEETTTSSPRGKRITRNRQERGHKKKNALFASRKKSSTSLKDIIKEDSADAQTVMLPKEFWREKQHISQKNQIGFMKPHVD